jgi:hypothetical protein
MRTRLRIAGTADCLPRGESLLCGALGAMRRELRIGSGQGIRHFSTGFTGRCRRSSRSAMQRSRALRVDAIRQGEAFGLLHCSVYRPGWRSRL